MAILAIPINNDKEYIYFQRDFKSLSKEESMTRKEITLSAIMILIFLLMTLTSINVQAETKIVDKTKVVTLVATKSTVTAYTLKECYHNNGITSSGQRVRPGIVAVSRDLEKMGMKLGTKIHIQNVGDFIVLDRTSPRLKNTIDIYMVSYRQAIKFGKRKLTVTFINT